MIFYKRKPLLVIVFVFFLVFNLFACKDNTNNDQTENLDKFSVNFIDVGDGDCILIKSKSGKHMLIDTGAKSTYESVKQTLTQLNVNTIDYLLLTNPTNEHVGAVENLLKDFNVGLAYIPQILDLSLFSTFKKAKETLLSKNVPIEISYQNEYLLIDDFHIAFLSPQIGQDGAYSQLNAELSPDKYQIGNVSPIILCQYSGVRFLFTGDAYKSQEALVLDLYSKGIYEQAFSYYGLDINLKNVDFLKVSANGDDNATSQEFLDLIKPKNAVVSVSSMNKQCPSSAVISRLMGTDQDFNLYRTDVHGTITVEVKENGEHTVKTQK